ncbi:hypothetical protein SAMN04488072_12118 [Lentibacillus halodurans]|uniref:PD-(D/E)XK nuclease superfamily protein n=1 Tax=Lentibacillus halodurans TaxID=237679 RepID=A0A1I1AMM0_9BACI|nr:hypothetical protein [Lentibacillus halodurans]SFB37640.1 hypothetical protein SAMN04488072_12118 [Lentibacillus halodurans]
MSLTSLLKGSGPNQKEFQTILREFIPNKKSFQTISGKEAFSKTDYGALVPYDLVKRDNSVIIGIAFDYLARIMLARTVKKNRIESYSNLTAKGGVMVLSRYFKNHHSIEAKLQKKYKKNIKRLKAFCDNNRDIKELILDVCFLAKLERIFRSGLPPTSLLEESFFDDPEDEVIKDLEQLCDVFQEKFIPTIGPISEIIYNPNFGVSSAFVGGADGDVIINGTLYDFKTGKNPGYNWQEVAQIVGYFLLNEISLDINNADENYFIDDSFQYLNIKQIAFYRARYGEVEYIDISYFDEELIETAKKNLASYFVKYSNFSKPMIENLHILKALANK